MNLKRLLFIAFFIALSGCSAVNSTFSCNETASDRCLSIEQVDHMTRFADDYYASSQPSKFGGKKKVNSFKHRTQNQGSKELVWIAPWKDKFGVAYKAQTIKSNNAHA